MTIPKVYYRDALLKAIRGKVKKPLFYYKTNVRYRDALVRAIRGKVKKPLFYNKTKVHYRDALVMTIRGKLTTRQQWTTIEATWAW